MTFDKCVHHTGWKQSSSIEAEDFCAECNNHFVWSHDGARDEAIISEVRAVLEKHGNVKEWQLSILEAVADNIQFRRKN